MTILVAFLTTLARRSLSSPSAATCFSARPRARASKKVPIAKLKLVSAPATQVIHTLSRLNWASNAGVLLAYRSKYRLPRKYWPVCVSLRLSVEATGARLPPL